ncbi:transmembrane protein 229B-like [Eucyclogobius newberryi]|uniref:transmembrane protein 229B-like n=1 Tax=Eucyclogobius newberryi TaxID=166745 RepID=UPI003B5C7F54
MELRGRKIQRGKDQTATLVESPVPPEPSSLPPAHPASPPPPTRLRPLARLYLYALHGLLCELLFTSAWDFLSVRDVRLRGHSSLWALPMYSTALFAVETLRRKLLNRHLPLPLRLTVYTSFIYLWEFLWGAGLSLVGACPWDYSSFTYNFKGLITLEYAPFWALGAFIAETFVIKNTLRIQTQ